ncbi:MAG TPA: EutN/CcmL family microcompartment protein [Myxococcota bacterium]|nr:EutN/CcmL family microcompartment protein [Myxococcota bacterium]HOA12478.1 EutN/CcmL family microcompartment protein [Myxococcota bacterium]HOD01065.1 EutN/CcmL family microcompartment protein [Myxococcota bacterium]HOH75783.1 EutN/CcmL family microcompartment protein [Myxococcota bacterium]HPV03271.1 EutN/CcmL family microcompartment protein [Myxococcota bacterium]
MMMGIVVGTVVSTRKNEDLVGLRFLVVNELDQNMKETGKMVVAADSLDAGVGEVVLYASGSSARQTEATKNRPVDATIMAIVDELAIDGRSRYLK